MKGILSCLEVIKRASSFSWGPIDYDHDQNDDDDDDDEDDDDDDEPEVLSAARHAQHDQPGQTHARQPANDYHSVSLFLFISVIVYLCHCLSLSLFIFQIHPCHLFAF